METLEVGVPVALKHILFATDFSPCAESALPYALSVAREYGSKVIVAHVLPPGPWPIVSHDAMPLQTDKSYSHGKREMADFLDSNPFHGVPYEVVLQKGEPWEAFNDIILKHDIDLIVLGIHGRHGIHKLLLGSVAEKVFHRAPCPVLTVGPKPTPGLPHDGELKRILFATDFSEQSLHALPYALSLAEKNRGHLTLLHVLQEPPSIVLENQQAAENPDRVHPRAAYELQKLLPPEGPYLWRNSEVVIQCGMPAEVILRVAAGKNAELIVMGVRRAGAALAAIRFPWATAHKVVAQAPCPVLTVRG